MSRPFQPHIITDDSAAGGQIFGGSLKFNSARTNYLKRYVSKVVRMNLADHLRFGKST